MKVLINSRYALFVFIIADGMGKQHIFMVHFTHKANYELYLDFWLKKKLIFLIFSQFFRSTTNKLTAGNNFYVSYTYITLLSSKIDPLRLTRFIDLPLL